MAKITTRNIVNDPDFKALAPEIKREVLLELRERELAEASVRIRRQERGVPFELRTPPSLAESREQVRAGVEALPGPARFAAEAAPSIIGTTIGAFTPAPVAGMAAGGVLGELFAQESGLAPRSQFALGAATAAPAVGPILGKSTQLGGRLGGAFLRKTPMVRAALSRLKFGEFVEQAGELGAQLLKRGAPARLLFQRLERFGFNIRPTDMPATLSRLDQLEKQFVKIRGVPEARNLLRLIKDFRRDMFIAGRTGGQERFTFESLMLWKQVLGKSIADAEAAAGLKLGARKAIFASIVDDIGKFPKKIPGSAAGVKLAERATRRAKLEFAVNDLEEIIVKYTKTIVGAGEEQRFGAAQVLDTIRGLTNPKSANFNKNFTDALKDQLPAIKNLFVEANKIEAVSAGGGAASLVIRGRTARAVERVFTGVGGFFGGQVLGGPVVGGMGAVAGAQLPERITAMLMTERGRKVLQGLLRFGRGKLPVKGIGIISQFTNKAVTEAGRQASQAAEEFLSP